MTGFKDHYKTLQLGPGSSLQQIKDNYRELALKNHPDQGGELASMAQLNEAYTTLADPESRQAYDYEYRDAYLLPTTRPVPPPAVEVKPAPAPDLPRRHYRYPAISWKRAFLALAAVVVIFAAFQLGRNNTAAQRPAPSPQQGASTAVQQADADAAASLKEQYDSCQNSVTQQQDALNSGAGVLAETAAQGNTDYYNALVANRAAAVDQYNATVQHCQQLRNLYNAAADTYNRSLQK